MDAFVAIDGVVRRFGDVVAVNEATLDVDQGNIVALLGPSGCGKTTLLRVIGGLEMPDSGVITLGATRLNGPGTFVAPERRQIGMVFQDYALFPHLNVGANVAFGLPRSADKKSRTEHLLELVGLPGLQRRMPHELSGGQQQRVALARALAAEPRLILLDEPFSNLDPSIRARVRGEVRELIRSIGITAIFVTHDQEEALSLADQVAVMFGGRILQVGTPREVYQRPATRRIAAFVGQPNFLHGEAAGGKVSCELGTFDVDAPVDGPVDVMIRSEDIVRVAEGGREATVVDISFFGHEEIVSLRLASGASVRARWRSSGGVEPGQQIQVAVCGRVQAYPLE